MARKKAHALGNGAGSRVDAGSDEKLKVDTDITITQRLTVNFRAGDHRQQIVTECLAPCTTKLFAVRVDCVERIERVAEFAYTFVAVALRLNGKPDQLVTVLAFGRRGACRKRLSPTIGPRHRWRSRIVHVH